MQGTVYFNASIFNILPNSDIKYFAKSNYMEIVLNEKFYKHKILFHNYLTNGTQNYQLKMENITLSPSIPGHIDKQQWYIKGELLAQDNNIISSLNFIRNKLNSLVESKHYYLNTLITINTQNIDKSLNFYYGSNISDTFLIKNNTYIEGQEGSDYYIIYGKNHLHDGIVIDNTSYDQALDFLIIQEEDAQFYLKEDNVDKGAAFHFIIPVSQAKPMEEYKIIVENDAEISAKPATQTANILMIDDEDTCLMSMELLLFGSNYNLYKAAGGYAGLEYLKEHFKEIDIILLDLMMPDIYGLNVLAEIKKDPELAKIPVILQTGSSDNAEIERAFELGIFTYIKKPYQKQDIMAEIESVLEKS
ncbi:Transcriptional regulatory protein AfsQ1 [Rickettsiales bacterium Ac37b]|nr:Transcriptional regulatory protein AfsQ1 [Rickettsiales bacterium Ac37b]